MIENKPPSAGSHTGTGASQDWSAARARMMLDPTVTMLNTGSFGPGQPISFSGKPHRCSGRLANAPRPSSAARRNG